MVLEAGGLCSDTRLSTSPSGLRISKAYQLGTEGNTRRTISAKPSISPLSSKGDCDSAWSTLSDRLSSTSTAVAARRVASRLRCLASSVCSETIESIPSPATKASGRIPANAMVNRRLRNGTDRPDLAPGA